MIFDIVHELLLKEKISKNDKIRFLNAIYEDNPIWRIENKIVLTPSRIDSDFEYWFGFYKGLAEKRGVFWRD